MALGIDLRTCRKDSSGGCPHDNLYLYCYCRWTLPLPKIRSSWRATESAAASQRTNLYKYRYHACVDQRAQLGLNHLVHKPRTRKQRRMRSAPPLLILAVTSLRSSKHQADGMRMGSATLQLHVSHFPIFPTTTAPVQLLGRFLFQYRLQESYVAKAAQHGGRSSQELG